MTLTLNQIVKRLQTVALAHKQVKHFYFSDIVEWLANGDVVYPAVFVDMPTGQISKTDKQTYFDFEIWFCDLLNVADRTRENELEVQSDLMSIATDYKAMLEYSEYLKTWTIDEDVAVTYYEEEFLEDVVAAVKLNIRIGVKNDSNRCWVPTDGLPFETEQNPMIITNYIYTGAGNEGNTLTLNNLQYKTAIMVFKGDKLLKKVSSAPGVNDYSFNTVTGVFMFGSDIEQDQIIQILNK